MRRFDSPEMRCERQLLAEVVIGRMAAFPESGHFGGPNTVEIRVRFRPLADVHTEQKETPPKRGLQYLLVTI